MATFNNIPLDILTNTYSFLDADSSLAFSLTCRSSRRAFLCDEVIREFVKTNIPILRKSIPISELRLRVCTNIGSQGTSAIKKTLLQASSELGVLSLSISSNGARAASRSHNSFFTVWDLKTYKPIQNIDTGREVFSIQIGSSGQRVLTGSMGRLQLWDAETRGCIRTMVIPGRHPDFFPVPYLQMSGDERKALSGSAFGGTHLWDLETGDCIRTLRMPSKHSGEISALHMSLDATRALVGWYDPFIEGFNTQIELLNLNTGTNQVKGNLEQSIHHLQISLDGSIALLGSKNGDLIIWNPLTDESFKIGNHPSPISYLSMNPEGTCAVSGSFDGTFKIWNLQTGKSVRTVSIGKEGVICAQVHPDGMDLLVSSEDNSLKVHTLLPLPQERIAAGSKTISAATLERFEASAAAMEPSDASAAAAADPYVNRPPAKRPRLE